MPDKVRTVMELAEQTARRMTGSGEQWMSFLTTAARLYKYPYQEQLLIYAQRPEATACASYELWNRTMKGREGHRAPGYLRGNGAAALCL